MRLRELYLTQRCFYLLGGIAALFLLAFPFAFLLPVAQALLSLFVIIMLADGWLLFHRALPVECVRHLPPTLSLSDSNKVRIALENRSGLLLDIELVDELPVELQQRDFSIRFRLGQAEARDVHYELTPLSRGRYEFGAVNVFASSFIGLVQRRQQFGQAAVVPVYPSVRQMKQYELMAFDRLNTRGGIKKIRRVGHSYEFEQIKNYVRGDDYRSINWKASGRHAALMVNQFTDERSQQVYCILDKSRTMRMPFNGLSLLEYAVNATLTISNIVLQKQDKAGLITFSDAIGTTIPADRRPGQLHLILEALHRERERRVEADFELLYHGIRRFVRNRSLLLLFTNFESHFALERVLPVLRRLNALHLLVVVFFENTEVAAYLEAPCADVREIYQHTMARKYLHEKVQIAQKLRQYGIQMIYTDPGQLSVNTINKYLELKAKGMA